MSTIDDSANSYLRSGSGASDFNAQTFLIQSLIRRISTITLVKVVSVTNSGGISPVGFVDILPLVNQLDGAGNAIKHLTVFKCPYFRLQGGSNAVILDPQVDDIGIALFADKDISKVIETKDQSNPDTNRRFSMADGLYLGGVLNGMPTQYIGVSATGIKLHSPTSIILEAPDVQINATTIEIVATATMTITTPLFTVNGVTVINGALTQGATGGAATIQGPLTVINDVTAAGKSVSLHHHVEHDGPSTGPPV